MTDTTPAIDPAIAAAPGSTAANPADREASPPTQADKSNKGRRRSLPGLAIALVLAVLVIAALAAALWYQRQQFERSGREIASRLDAVSAELATVRREARQSLSLAQSHDDRLRALDQTLADVQGRFAALEQALQTFGDGSGDVQLLNDVEQLLTLANQQLRLGGSVSNAIVALETAQARLARAERPAFATLMQAINGDLDRLRAVPMVDVPALASKVDQLIALTARAPLLVPDAAAPGAGQPASAASGGPMPPQSDAPEPADADASWWQRWRAEIASWPQRAAAAVGRELADMISIQRVDEAGALLLSPEQGAQLRANIRMRLLTAQVALLMRQPAIWTNEIDAVAAALAASYDARSPDTVAAQRLARELGQAEIAVKLPGLSASLAAAATLRASLGDAPARAE